MDGWRKKTVTNNRKKAESIMERPKRKRSLCYIGGIMCSGILAMVVFFTVLRLFMSNNNQYQYKQQHPSANNAISLVPISKSTSSFKLQGFEIIYTSMVVENNFTKIHSEWDMLYTTLQKKLSKKGLKGPSERHCFLWHMDCYSLAKHPIIVKNLIPILGPDIILYGIKNWRLANGTARNLHLDTESGDCDEVANVVIGSKIRLLKGSQMCQGKWRHTLINTIAALDTYRNHVNIEDIIIGTVRRGVVRKPGNPMEDVSFISIEPGEGNMVIFHGKAVYRIETASIGEDTMILQFASAKCKIRDNIQVPNNVFLPPVLLISGTYDMLSSPNDVREVMASTEGFIFVPKTADILNPFAPAEKNLSLFSWKNLSTKCKTKHSYRTCSYGSASTAILSKVSFEYSDSKAEITRSRELTSDDEEKVVIVLNGSLLYFCAEMEVQGYREMSVLEIHGLAYVPVGGWHAIVPASPYRNTFISVHWQRRKMATDKKWSGFRGFFGFQMIMLQSGQAYDPSNENNCDVILVMLYGKSLQMFPSEIFLEESQTLLISGGEPCLLWNIGKTSVAFVAIDVCGYDEQIQHLFNGDPDALSYFSVGGRIMRKF